MVETDEKERNRCFDADPEGNATKAALGTSKMKMLPSAQSRMTPCFKDDSSACGAATSASEDSTLSECFDSDNLLASSRFLDMSVCAGSSDVAAHCPHNRDPTRWKSGCTDIDHEPPLLTAFNVHGVGVEVADAMEVGFAALRAMKFSSGGSCDDRNLTGASGLKLEEKEDEILIRLDEVISNYISKSDSVLETDALEVLNDRSFDSRGNSRSGTFHEGIIDGSSDNVPTMPSRRHSNEFTLHLQLNSLNGEDNFEEESECSSSIPSLVDIESPDWKREQIDPNALIPSLATETQPTRSIIRRANHNGTGPIHLMSSGQQHQMVTPFSVSSPSRRKRSTSSKRWRKYRSSLSPNNLRKSRGEGRKLPIAFGEKESGVRRSSSKKNVMDSPAGCQQRLSLEPRRSLSERKCLQENLKIDIMESVGTERPTSATRQKKAGRQEKELEHYFSKSKSDQSVSSDAVTRRSLTRRDIRKCLSDRRLQQEQATTELETNSLSSPRKGRRQRSERSQGSLTTFRSTLDMGEERDTPMMSPKVCLDRTPKKRSLSFDAARLQPSTPNSKPTDTLPPRSSLAQQNRSSFGSLAHPRESHGKLRRSGGSLRNLTAGSGSSLRSSFHRRKKNVCKNLKEEKSCQAGGTSFEANGTLMNSQSCVSKDNQGGVAVLLPPPPPPMESPSTGKLTPKLKPPKKDSLPYSSPGSHHRRPVTPQRNLPLYPRKSLSLSHLDCVLSSVPGKPAGGDAAVASMAWEPASAATAPSSVTKSPGTTNSKRRAKKGERLKRFLHLQGRDKGAPLAEQESEEDDEEMRIVPLHYLDAKREITRNQHTKKTDREGSSSVSKPRSLRSVVS
ncbi:hypothetical protein IV203_017927 [Nitzschia inconspicua]|uniref:Uncharacterized protein n=1 Tax=Nitzschia inconspicua TaxID=303405 RepID=A0A9K3Q608_9STRA|nr:hypothetical protein IV203_017927 [Nitzschia inconspicua]